VLFICLNSVFLSDYVFKIVFWGISLCAFVFYHYVGCFKNSNCKIFYKSRFFKKRKSYSNQIDLRVGLTEQSTDAFAGLGPTAQD
jgi:hypothetical protein